MFISLEGVDNSGKTTMSIIIEEYLKEKNKEVILTREPGGTSEGREIRKILINENFRDDPLDVQTQTLLLYAGRVAHVRKVIIPALMRGGVVVTDRYIDSSIVYQGLHYGADDLIRDLTTKVTGLEFLSIRPDYTIFFDIDYDTMVKRMASRVNNALDEKYLQEGYELVNLWKQYFYELQKKMPGRIFIIDANGSIDEVQRATQCVMDSICENGASLPTYLHRVGDYISFK